MCDSGDKSGEKIAEMKVWRKFELTRIVSR